MAGRPVLTAGHLTTIPGGGTIRLENQEESMSTGISLKGKVAVVPGASSGLGERFAEVLSGAGAAVALAARRPERLADLAGRYTSAGGRAIPGQGERGLGEGRGRTGKDTG